MKTRASTIVKQQRRATDTYGRLRVTEPELNFGSLSSENLDLAAWETITSGTGAFAYTVGQASGQLSTSALNDTVRREQHGYLHPVPGFSQVVIFAVIFGAAQASVIKRAGILNTTRGFFFEQNGTNGFRIVTRYSASDTPVEQANWNINKVEHLDLTKLQLFFVEFGAAKIRFGLYIDSELTYVHEIVLANTVALFAPPKLPITYYIQQNGATPGTLIQGPSYAQTEAGSRIVRKRTGITMQGVARVIPAGARQSILSVRLKQFLSSGVANRRICIPISYSLITDSDLFLEVVIQHIVDGTPVYGGTPTWVDAGTKSGLEYTDDITTVTGGNRTHAAAGFAGKDGSSASDSLDALLEPTGYLARNSANTNSDIVHLIANNIDSKAANIYAGMDFVERF